jgi:carboxypeptidase Taq
VQFFNTAKAKIPNLEAHIAKGNLLPLKTWLNTEIHRLSRIETPAEIVQRVTGEPLNAGYFVDYLWEKFGDIYKLQRPSSPKKLVTAGKRS